MARNEFFTEKRKTAKNFTDLTGKKFGKLTVIKLVGRRIYNEKKPTKGTPLWLCICDCGKEKITSSHTLKAGGATTCRDYKCKPCHGRFKKGHKSPESTIDKFAAVRSRYKTDARRRGYSWELHNKEFDEIIVKPCVYCEKSETNSEMYNNWGLIKFTGIDRLDNNKGYTLENAVPCCKQCNSDKKGCTPQIIKVAYKLLFGDKND